MLKTTFTSAAIAAVVQAVNTREFINSISSELISDNLAQTEAEAEGCGDTPRGQPVKYLGPSEYQPLNRQSLTPGMNLAQTSALSGEAAPTPKDLKFAQSKNAKTSKT